MQTSVHIPVPKETLMQWTYMVLALLHKVMRSPQGLHVAFILLVDIF